MLESWFRGSFDSYLHLDVQYLFYVYVSKFTHTSFRLEQHWFII